MLNTQLSVICQAVIIFYNTTSTDKINRISSHFWDRWRHDYVVNLRETQRILYPKM